MTRAYAILVTLALGLLLAWRVALAATYTEPSPFTTQQLVVCYETDGQQVRTAYIERGSADLDPYPIELTETVSGGGGGVVTVRHEVTLRRLAFHVFLPGMVR